MSIFDIQTLLANEFLESFSTEPAKSINRISVVASACLYFWPSANKSQEHEGPKDQFSS